MSLASLVVLGALAGAAVLEGALRLASLAVRRPAPPVHAGPGRVILCLGESTTAPPLMGEDRSWPRQLQALLAADPAMTDVVVVNAGVPGTTSAEIAARLPSALESYRPSLVIAMIGVNDSKWYGLGGGEGALARLLASSRLVRALRLGRDALTGAPAPAALDPGIPLRRRIRETILSRGLPLVLMQYPGLGLAALEREVGDEAGQPGLALIETKRAFDAAGAWSRYDDYFVDRFAGGWGHATERGNALIAAVAFQAAGRALEERPAGPAPRASAARQPDPDPALERARRLVAEGRLDEAAALTRRLAGERPTDAEPLEMLVGLEHGRPQAAADAEAAGKTAAGAAPGAARTHMVSTAARLLVGEGAPDGARALLQAALARSPRDVELLLKAADLEADPRRAESLCKRAVAALPEAPLPVRAGVERQCSNKRAFATASRSAGGPSAEREEEVRESARRVAAAHPLSPEPLERLVELERGDPRAARDVEEAGRRVLNAPAGPGRSRLLATAARLLAGLGESPKARTLLDEALARSPGDAELLRQASDLARTPQRAADLCERAARSLAGAGVPERFETLRLCAQRAYAAGRRTTAFRRAEEALALRPLDLAALTVLLESAPDRARALAAAAGLEKAARGRGADGSAALLAVSRARRRLGDAPGARAALRQAVEAAPGDALAVWELLAAGGEPSALADDADRAAAAAEGQPPERRAQVYLACAAAHERAGDGRAESWRRRAAETDPRSAARPESPADPCFDAGRRDRATLPLPFFDDCLRRHPGSAVLLADRGVARYLAGDAAGAEADLRKALSRDPGSKTTRKSLETVLAATRPK